MVIYVNDLIFFWEDMANARADCLLLNGDWWQSGFHMTRMD
jgi:hypothetical protein